MTRRRIGRAIVATGLFVTGLAALSAPAHADQECHWNASIGQLECSNTSPGGDPGEGGSGGGGGGGGALGFWTVWRNDIQPEPNACPVDPATGEVPARRYLQFIPAGNPAGTITATNWCPPADVPVPPPPPTAAEIRGLADAPAPEINLAPASRGVTGVPTRLWGADDAGFTVGPLSLRGWSITGSATPTHWTWETGTGESLSSSTAGSSGSPAAIFTYETKGTYAVETSVAYTGNFVVVGPYGVTINAAVGAITVSGSQSYDVVEVRAARD